jgi:hypothetical protein
VRKILYVIEWLNGAALQVYLRRAAHPGPLRKRAPTSGTNVLNAVDVARIDQHHPY